MNETFVSDVDNDVIKNIVETPECINSYENDDSEVLCTDYFPQTAGEIQTYVNNASDGDIIVLNGTYSLESTISVNKSLTFSGVNNAIVDGLSNVRLFTLTNGNVIFKNITFVNGYFDEGSAICGNCTAMNCTFRNNNAYGSGSYGYDYSTGKVVLYRGVGGAISGECNVTDCIFINNSAGNRGGALYGGGNSFNCTFINNSARRSAAGAVHGYNAFNCTFINNSVEGYGWTVDGAGGAMYQGSAMNCTFINNSAGNKGGALYQGRAMNCTFINNSALAGGAIFESNVINCIFACNNAQFTYGNNRYGPGYDTTVIYSGGAMCGGRAENCTFINNSADYGGAIYNGGAINSNFINNNATNGGAIFADSRYLLLDNCIFKNNNATNGGALYYNYDCEEIQNFIFDNNTASDNGNQIFINSSNVFNTYDWLIKITNCTFTNCFSSTRCKSIDLTNRKNSKNNYLSFSKCKFINCSSDTNGGAISLVNVNSYSVNDCYFEGNSAIKGGAIYYDELVSSINNCHFKNNFAQFGGAIFYQNYNKIKNCIFESNIASNQGNEIFINESTEINIEHCNFTDCSSNEGWFIEFNKVESLSISDCNFVNCSSKTGGGAIYLSNIQSVNIFNSYFKENGQTYDNEMPRGGSIYLERVSKSNISNCNFTENTAGLGGAIYITDSMNCFIDNCVFEYNFALFRIRNGIGWNVGGGGGAILVDDSKNIIVNNSKFENNNAEYGSGGSIGGDCTVANSCFIQNHGMSGGALTDCHAVNCTFIQNNVWGRSMGGAMFNCTAVNCTFEKNRASDGAAMYGGAAVNCTFTNNKGSYGGAMYAVSAENCTFINNSADYGGVFYYEYSQYMAEFNVLDKIIDCSFINNSADEEGGAIFIEKGHDFYIKNCEFINCSSTWGGAIYLINGSDFNISRCSFENCSSTNGSYLSYDDVTSNFDISDCIFDVVPEGVEFKYNPILTVHDVRIVKGENGILIANLSDINGQLSNKTLKFSVNGNIIYYNNTDVNGILLFDFNEYLNQEGYYNVTVSFEGDNHTNPISTNVNVYIYLYEGILTVTRIGKYYDEVVLSFKLINSKTNEDIDNATIKVEFTNGEVFNLTTNNNGIANYDVPFSPGTYGVTAHVTDDNVDVNNATLSDIVINNIEGLMKVTQVDNTMLNVRLYNPSNGDAYKNINVTLKFENMDPVYVVTNNQGIATYTMDFDYGTYSVLAFVSKPYTDIGAVSVDDIVIKEDNSYAKVKFSSGIVFEYGSSGSIYVTVDGGTVEREGIKVLDHKEAKITLEKNVITISNLNPGKYTLFVQSTPYGDFKPGNGTVGITVNKATAVIKASKITVALKKGTQWSIQLVNSKTGKPIANMEITLKIFTGKKFKTVTVKTNSKGIATYQTKKLSKGNHKVVVSGKHAGYNFNTVTTSIKVIKPKALKFKLKKKVDDKDGSLRSFMVLDKKTNKGVNGIKIKVLIYTGKKYKAYTFKTKKIKGNKGTYNGAFGFATNKFSAGKHKVKIMPASIKYKGSITTYIKLSKKATGKNVPKFMREA